MENSFNTTQEIKIFKNDIQKWKLNNNIDFSKEIKTKLEKLETKKSEFISIGIKENDIMIEEIDKEI